MLGTKQRSGPGGRQSQTCLTDFKIYKGIKGCLDETPGRLCCYSEHVVEQVVKLHRPQARRAVVPVRRWPAEWMLARMSMKPEVAL